MLSLPSYITLVFILTTLAAYVMFVLSVSFSGNKAVSARANMIAILLLLWLIFQSTLSLNGWYMDRKAMPPHMLFPVTVAVSVIVLLFVIPKGKKLLDGLSLKILAWLHLIRLPVELCLYWLAQNKQVPWSMTFEGYNFDIAFGITAPLVAVLYFNAKKMSRKVFLAWNILGLISVLAIVIRAAGALPSPIQWWDFRQPNYAIMHFPFIWLPSFLAPAVILAHLTAIRRSMKNGME